MCKYDARTKEVKMSYNCWFSIGAYHSRCEPSDIRKISTTDWFDTNIKYMYGNSSSDYIVCDGFGLAHCTAVAGSKHFVHPYFAKDTTTNTYLATLSLRKAFCAGSYQSFMNRLQADYASQATASSIINSCKNDPNSIFCKGSPYLVDRLARFKNNAGYAIDYVGPFCNETNIAAASKLMPNPYEYFVTCGLFETNNSQVCGSAVVDQFMADLKTAAGRECGSCFDEIKESIEALATDANVKSACADASSDGCKAALKSTLDAFKQCTGFDMVFADKPVESEPTTTSTTKSGHTSFFVGTILLVVISMVM
jgi:hypothetical protein